MTTELSQKPIVIMVHGLGSSPAKTWAKFDRLVTAELGLDTFCYEYPTRKLRLPFMASSSPVPLLAAGLKSAVNTRFEDRPLILVGHSLGGVIVRQFIVDELTTNSGREIPAVFLYASPHTGSHLASIASMVSWRNAQLAQICKDSPFLDQLNERWVQLKPWESLRIIDVQGGQDKAVPPRGTLWPDIWPERVITADHRNIVQPEQGSDLSFQIFARHTRAIVDGDQSSGLTSEPDAVDGALSKLAQIGEDSRNRVKRYLGQVDDEIQVARTEPLRLVDDAALEAGATLVIGESGVGKSAVAAAVASKLESEFDTLVHWLNLRELGGITELQFQEILGASFEDIFNATSARPRCLIIDAAEAGATVGSPLLVSLVDRAAIHNVPCLIVTTPGAKVALQALLRTTAYADPAEYVIEGLSDDELAYVAEKCASLAPAIGNESSRELLRRPIVCDLLIRSRSVSLPLSEADVLQQVWTHLVARPSGPHGVSGLRREQTLLAIARHRFAGSPPSSLLESMDGDAVEDLIAAAILVPATGFELVPSFAHDILSVFASARLLLVDNKPTEDLLVWEVPRWALPSARLACQLILKEHTVPLDSQHASFGLLATAGYGERWHDVPIEAAIGLPNAAELLTAKPGWVESPEVAGRVLRIIKQQSVVPSVSVSALGADMVAMMLDRNWPAIDRETVDSLLRSWLRGLAVIGSSSHPLRKEVERRILQAIATSTSEASWREPEMSDAVSSGNPHATVSSDDIQSCIARFSKAKNLPAPMENPKNLEMLALLGSDLSETTQLVFKEVGRNHPHLLGEIVEDPWCVRSLCTADFSLAAKLTEQYYIDERHDWYADDGIRHHISRDLFEPQASPTMGPFLLLFRFDFRRAAASLNRILNHAAEVRSDTSAPGSQGADPHLALDMNGEPTVCVGDAHVWYWYRGSSVGPYPCMSALAALELIVDELLANGNEIGVVADILLAGCRNLAIPGLLYGILIRHSEIAGRAVDRFLQEPWLFDLELERYASEGHITVLPKSSVHNAERLAWEPAFCIANFVIGTDDDRADELLAVGETLKAKATALNLDENEAGRLASVAGFLNRDAYRVHRDGGRQMIANADVIEANPPVEPTPEQLHMNEVLRIRASYRTDEDVTPAQLVQDVQLIRNGEADADLSGLWGWPVAAALVAQRVIEAEANGTHQLDAALTTWAAALLLDMAGEVLNQERSAYAEQSFSNDTVVCSLARALPHLYTARLAPVLVTLEHDQLDNGWQVLSERGSLIAYVWFGQGLRMLWSEPCTADANCAHERALDWADQLLLRSLPRANDLVADFASFEAVVETLTDIAAWSRYDESERPLIPYAPRLSGPIEATVGASTPACMDGPVIKKRFDAALTAHAHALRIGGHYHHCHSDVEVVAHALLCAVGAGDEVALWQHLALYKGDITCLSRIVRAITSAATQDSDLGSDTSRLWPQLVTYVLDELGNLDRPLNNYSQEVRWLVAGLMPHSILNRDFDVPSMYEGRPRPRDNWVQRSAWEPVIDRWVDVAAGSSSCMTNLLAVIDATGEQPSTKELAWIERLVAGDPKQLALYQSGLSDWLRSARGQIDDDALVIWQRIVDSLIVNGAPDLGDLRD